MIRRAAAMTLLVLLAVLCVLPSAAPAEGGVKTIRVGWYDTPFNHKDSFEAVIKSVGAGYHNRIPKIFFECSLILNYYIFKFLIVDIRR